MEERGATDEGSLSQDGQMCNRCHMYRKEQLNHNLQDALTEYLIQLIIYVKCVDPAGRATQPPLHPGDLEEGRPHEIIRSKTEKIRERRHQTL